MQIKQETGKFLDLLKMQSFIPEFLKDIDRWKSKYIDYEHPYVERLWIDFCGYRLSLHAIHPCTRDEAFYHPHPWPSAIKILRGSYEMGIGYGTSEPPLAGLIILKEGSTYEMTDPLGWHYVRPLAGITYTFMITGVPYEKSEAEKSSKPLSPLDPARKEELIEFFRKIYI